MKFSHRTAGFILFSSILLSCSGNISSSSAFSKIVIAFSDANYEKVNNFICAFNKIHPDISFEFVSMENEKLNYYFRHNQLNADIVCLEDLIELRPASSRFVDFSSSELVNRFSKYILNYMELDDGKICCLPSPGGFYCNVINNGILEKYSMTLPRSLSTMLDYATNIKSQITPFLSSFKGNKQFLDLFMQATVSTYFSNPVGNDVFKKYYKGDCGIVESDDYDHFRYLLNKNYRQMYSSGFASVDSTGLDNVERFLNGESLILSVSPQLDFDKIVQQSGKSIRYSYIPYVGNTTDESWLPFTSDFFFSVNKDSYYGIKKTEIDEICDFFSTEEGQYSLMKDENGEKSNNRISYLSDQSYQFTGNYQELNQLLNRGRVYYVDDFLHAFGFSVASMKEFICDEIDGNQLIQDMDDNISIHNNYVNNKVYFKSLLGKGKLATQQKEMVGAVLKIIANFKKLDVILCEDSFIKQDIFDGMIFEDEMRVVFDEDCQAIYSTLNGDELIKMAQDIPNGYSLFGITKKGEDYVTGNQVPVNSQRKYRVLLSKKYLLDHGISLGGNLEEVNLLQYLKTCLALKR